MTEQPLVPEEILSRVKGWRDYAEAKLGFRNHWYPVRFSHEIDEGGIATLKILGENLLLKRIDGRVYAVRDRCLHRGVQFSKKLECYTRDTLTCWYHGFTYRFTTGELINIMAVPNSKLIGRKKVKTYPVQEAKGVIFVFLGDDVTELPPLAQDVPPNFLDDDMAILGEWRTVKSNWRVGAENGFDSIHIFIHKDTVLRRYREMNFPLGHIPMSDEIETVEETAGPKGVIDDFHTHKPVWEGVIDGEVVVKGTTTTSTAESARTPSASAGVSMWLPCVLKVHPFPVPHVTQFEWYVPIDEGTHIYFQTLGKHVSTPEAAREWTNDFNSRWRTVALHGFNDDDVWAREATEPFYADDWGWINETLCEPDKTLVEWRKLASRHNRGIQRPEHLR